MKIYGIGTDIVNTIRIKQLLNKKKKIFKNRIFTDLEIKTWDKRINKIECYAKRFAAKEALFKAIGLKSKLNFKDVEINNNKSGAPKFLIKGKSLNNLKKLFKYRKFSIHLSLSDDKPWAVASVIVFTL